MLPLLQFLVVPEEDPLPRVSGSGGGGLDSVAAGLITSPVFSVARPIVGCGDGSGD